MTEFGFSAAATAVSFDGAPHSGEPDAGSAEFAGRMQPLEHLEKLVAIAHVESGTVVGDSELVLRLPLGCGDGYPRMRLPSCVLEGVAEQIQQDLLEQDDIAAASRQWSDVDIHLAIFAFVAQLFDVEIRLSYGCAYAMGFVNAAEAEGMCVYPVMQYLDMPGVPALPEAGPVLRRTSGAERIRH